MRTFIQAACTAGLVLACIPLFLADASSVPRSSEMRDARILQASVRAQVDDRVVQGANAWFNGITGMTGRFLQRNHEGRTAAGDMLILRPGRILFRYDEPATMEIVSDGRLLAVRDSRLKTQDIIPLSQTPMKFFLARNVDLDASMNVLEAYVRGDEAVVTFEDATTLGGRSVITLVFDQNLRNLKQWIIVDPQGFQTSVSLSRLQRQERIDAHLFFIDHGQFRN